MNRINVNLWRRCKKKDEIEMGGGDNNFVISKVVGYFLLHYKGHSKIKTKFSLSVKTRNTLQNACTLI